MTTKPVAVDYETGQTLYWFPLSRSLADWLTYRVQAVEDSAPDLGKYLATLDTAACNAAEDEDCVFVLFVGADQPANFATGIKRVSALSLNTAIASTAALEAEVAKIPRAAAALTPGGNFTRTKQSETSTVITERMS